MKKLLMRLILREKFIGQIAAASASAAAAYLVSLIPGAPELVVTILGSVLGIPEGSEITTGSVTIVLTPVILAILNAVVQEMVAKDNNKMLTTLTHKGSYTGPLDGWVGPEANAAAKQLRAVPIIKDDEPQSPVS